MSNESANWGSRLCVSFIPDGGAAALISPITNFNASFSAAKEIIDSIDADNVGISKGNRRFTFDFEVPAVNMTVYREILNTIVKDAKFSIVMATKAGESDDWYLDAIEFADCYVTEVNPGSISNDGKPPVMKVSAICLNVIFSNDGKTLMPNHTVGGTGSL